MVGCGLLLFSLWGSNQNPDFQACLAGHEDVVQLLLAKGASAKANGGGSSG